MTLCEMFGKGACKHANNANGVTFLGTVNIFPDKSFLRFSCFINSYIRYYYNVIFFIILTKGIIFFLRL